MISIGCRQDLVGSGSVHGRASSKDQTIHPARVRFRTSTMTASMKSIIGKRMKMKLKPLHDRVLVKRIEEEEKETRGGIVVPDTAKEKPQEGEVIAVGDGKVLESGEKLKMAVKKGDRVLFGKYSGSEVKLGDEEYLIMREDDVLGILQKKVTYSKKRKR